MGIRERKGRGHQGTYTKDPWTKPKMVDLRMGGSNGWSGGHGVVKMETTVLEQQYKKIKRKNPNSFTWPWL